MRRSQRLRRLLSRPRRLCPTRTTRRIGSATAIPPFQTDEHGARIPKALQPHLDMAVMCAVTGTGRCTSPGPLGVSGPLPVATPPHRGARPHHHPPTHPRTKPSSDHGSCSRARPAPRWEPRASFAALGPQTRGSTWWVANLSLVSPSCTSAPASLRPSTRPTLPASGSRARASASPAGTAPGPHGPRALSPPQCRRGLRLAGGFDGARTHTTALIATTAAPLIAAATSFTRPARAGPDRPPCSRAPACAPRPTRLGAGCGQSLPGWSAPTPSPTGISCSASSLAWLGPCWRPLTTPTA